MTMIASWAMGMAVWVGSGGKGVDGWWALLGVGMAPFIWNRPRQALAVWAVLILWVITRLVLGRIRKPNRAYRQAFVRYWQTVGMCLSAGLTFWQAVDFSARNEPLIADRVLGLAHDLVYPREGYNAIMQFRQRFPGPEAEVISNMMAHGYRHGLNSQDALEQAEEMEDRLALEEELKRHRDPLWMSILPAVLLLNVLMLFVASMAGLLNHSWVQL